MDIFDRSKIEELKHSPLRNYIVPGLTSWMIVDKLPNGGCIRMFEMDRYQEMAIAPHSHRFDFWCYVLEGEVTNTIWRLAANGDTFKRTHLEYNGTPGDYERTVVSEPSRYFPFRSNYSAGDYYSMVFSDIHSIQFSKGAKVLFIEGPQITDTSILLDPYSADHHIPQSETKSWMFQSDWAHGE